jgi:hypothetical protein
MWCIPPEQDAAFVAQMEQVLEVYQRPYDPEYPVVAMDEQHKQLISETHTPLPAEPGRPERIDSEYVREGACVVWMFVEPLAGWRNVEVTETRTAIDWAHQVRRAVDEPRYAEAKRITLVCDNLNTHTIASLYQAFEPSEALRLARKLELVHTPKHGSWLNMAEPELSVLTRQAIRPRTPDASKVVDASRHWCDRRNTTPSTINWRFTTDKARNKLKYLYPKIIN